MTNERHITFNRLNVLHNPYQEHHKYKRVLTVCTAGCLRSPTAAIVLAAAPYNYNTRSCGAEKEVAIVSIDDALIEWADELVFMETHHLNMVARDHDIRGKNVVVLNIPDSYPYRDPILMETIKARYDEAMETRSHE